MGVTFSQFFPPSPTLTESNLPSQVGRVFLVTGATSGVGFELARLLYHAGGKVYIGARSEAKADAAISRLQSSSNQGPHGSGSLHPLIVSLDDLTTIKPAAEAFLAQEQHLHVLFNNAGISLLNKTYLSPQGHEIHLATNCLGPFLLTTLLLPAITAAAQRSPKHTTRVVWTGSIVVDMESPSGGFRPSTSLPPHTPPTQSAKVNANYTLSKTGNWYLAAEFAARYGFSGLPSGPQVGTEQQQQQQQQQQASTIAPDRNFIISLCQNPGNLKTSLLRYSSSWIPFLVGPLLYHARYGAYTALWAGLSDEITAAARSDSGVESSERNPPIKKGSKGAFWNGGYVIPWGRMHPAPRQDLLEALEQPEQPTTASGSTIAAGRSEVGKATEFWDWCEQQVQPYR